MLEMKCCVEMRPRRMRPTLFEQRGKDFVRAWRKADWRWKPYAVRVPKIQNNLSAWKGSGQGHAPYSAGKSDVNIEDGS